MVSHPNRSKASDREKESRARLRKTLQRKLGIKEDKLGTFYEYTIEGGAAQPTPFTEFWSSLNRVMAAKKLPDIRYGVARALWGQVIDEAEKDFYQGEFSRLAQSRMRS